MNNTFYFLRHAETEINKNTPVSEWTLSEHGNEQAKQITESDTFDKVEMIITSDEEKAFQTAKPLADKLRREITRFPELNELHMDDGGFLTQEKHDETMKFALADIYTSENHWEPAHNALERFSKKIDEIENEHRDKKILIVAHGIVINLYFSMLLDKLDHVYERIQKNAFCDWGIVQNRRIIRDIAK